MRHSECEQDGMEGCVFPVTFPAFQRFPSPARYLQRRALHRDLRTDCLRDPGYGSFWGWLAVVLTYRLGSDPPLGSGGAGVGAAPRRSPWHVGFSRLGVEASGPLLPALLAGLICGWRWYRTWRRHTLVLAGLFFALALYAYTIAQALVPLLGAIALVFWKPLRRISEEQPRPS